MNVATARQIVRQYARNASDANVFSDADIDRAIQVVCVQFCQKTGCLKTTSSVTLTDGSSTCTAPSSPFRPELTKRAWIGTRGFVDVVSHEEVLRLQVEEAKEGLPTMLAWTSATAGVVYPTPDANYTLTVQWAIPFTTWTPGGSLSPDLLALPDEILLQVLPWGPPARLQFSDPDQLYASPAWQEYLRVESTHRGLGAYGARSLQRVLPEED